MLLSTWPGTFAAAPRLVSFGGDGGGSASSTPTTCRNRTDEGRPDQTRPSTGTSALPRPRPRSDRGIELSFFFRSYSIQAFIHTDNGRLIPTASLCAGQGSLQGRALTTRIGSSSMGQAIPEPSFPLRIEPATLHQPGAGRPIGSANKGDESSHGPRGGQGCSPRLLDVVACTP